MGREHVSGDKISDDCHSFDIYFSNSNADPFDVGSSTTKAVAGFGFSIFVTITSAFAFQNIPLIPGAPGLPLPTERRAWLEMDMEPQPADAEFTDIGLNVRIHRSCTALPRGGIPGLTRIVQYTLQIQGQCLTQLGDERRQDAERLASLFNTGSPWARSHEPVRIYCLNPNQPGFPRAAWITNSIALATSPTDPEYPSVIINLEQQRATANAFEKLSATLAHEFTHLFGYLHQDAKLELPYLTEMCCFSMPDFTPDARRLACHMARTRSDSVGSEIYTETLTHLLTMERRSGIAISHIAAQILHQQHGTWSPGVFGFIRAIADTGYPSEPNTDPQSAIIGYALGYAAIAQGPADNQIDIDERRERGLRSMRGATVPQIRPQFTLAQSSRILIEAELAVRYSMLNPNQRRELARFLDRIGHAISWLMDHRHGDASLADVLQLHRLVEQAKQIGPPVCRALPPSDRDLLNRFIANLGLGASNIFGFELRSFFPPTRLKVTDEFLQLGLWCR